MIRNEKINSLQFIFIIVQLQVGVGILTMPYDIYNKAGGDSWLSILLAGLFIQVLLTGFHFLMKAYPNDHFFTIIQKVFGRVIGHVLILIYIMYFIVLAMSLLSRYASILCTWMMPLTPIWILIILMTVIVVYGALDGLETIGRFFFIASFIFIYFLYFIVLAMSLLSRYASILITWMMPLTPKWILISLMTVIVVYGAMDGLETIGRFLFIASFILIVYVGFSIYALKFMQI